MALVSNGDRQIAGPLRGRIRRTQRERAVCRQRERIIAAERVEDRLRLNILPVSKTILHAVYDKNFDAQRTA